MNDWITIQLQDFSFPGRFPDMCIFCSKPKETELKYSVDKKVANITHNIEMHLPYCEDHVKIAQRNKKVDNILTVIGTIFGLPTLVVSLIWLWPQGSSKSVFDALISIAGSLVLAIIAGMIVFGIVFYSLRFLMNFIIHKRSGYPIDYPFGVSIRLPNTTDTIDLTFKNTDVGQKFKEINYEYIKQDNL